jgi:hypothetical protein
VVPFHPGNHLGGILLLGVLNNCFRVTKVLKIRLITQEVIDNVEFVLIASKVLKN